MNNLSLIEKHLKVVGESLQLGLYGPTVEAPNGHIRTDLRGSDSTISDGDILFKNNNILTNIQINQSGGYTYLDPLTDSEIINRNKKRATNRLEIETDFIGFYIVKYEINNNGLPTPANGDYVIVTENFNTYIKDELYYYNDNKYNKVSLYDYKIIIPYNTLTNFKVNKLYYYSSNSNPKWIPINVDKDIEYTIDFNNINGVYNNILDSIESGYSIDTIHIYILEDFSDNSIFNLNIDNYNINLDNTIPKELVVDNLYKYNLFKKYENNTNITFDGTFENRGKLKIIIKYRDRYYY